jgi:hypothetical protein
LLVVVAVHNRHSRVFPPTYERKTTRSLSAATAETPRPVLVAGQGAGSLNVHRRPVPIPGCQRTAPSHAFGVHAIPAAIDWAVSSSAVILPAAQPLSAVAVDDVTASTIDAMSTVTRTRLITDRTLRPPCEDGVILPSSFRGQLLAGGMF